MKKNVFFPILTVCAVLAMFSCSETAIDNTSLEDEKKLRM